MIRNFLRVPNLPQRDHPQLVYCPKCKYALHITVQERRGSHGCAECGGQMEVWEPRGPWFGGLRGRD